VANEPLSQREFDLWREADEEFKRAVLKHVEAQVALNLASEQRLTKLETHREHAIISLGIFTSLVAAIVGGMAGLFFGR
jgi:hypothetical protein